MLHEAGLHFDVLSLLENQQRSYTVDLGRAHQTLSKLYRKLAQIEHDLSQRHELGLTRKDKKRLQWSRSELKHTAAKIEFQQASLHEYLRQCGSLMASYASQTSTPWTMSVPSTPSQSFLTPFTPFTPGLPWASSNSSSGNNTQYWDLSMLPERNQSPFANHTVDSARFQPGQLLGNRRPTDDADDCIDPHHVFAHEIVAQQQSLAPADTSHPRTAATEASESLRCFRFPNHSSQIVDHTDGRAVSGAHDEGSTPSTPTGPQKRRLSENAIQIIEARLASHAAGRKQSSSHKRGISWTGSTTSTIIAAPLVEIECETASG